MGANVADLTTERLREVLHYCPETGCWTWLVNRRAGARIGNPAGNRQPAGYLKIKIDGRLYLAHRLAFLYVTGAWPPGQVDHRDLNKSNNRWSNLRKSTSSQNSANRKTRSDSLSGLKGVTWHTQNNKWWAKISIDGKRKSLGQYDCPAAAHFAYLVAADKLFGEFARAA
jgi:hypothetical protein